MKSIKVLGIDIGGSGMKAAVVDVRTGKLLTDRYRVKTPDPSTPEAMAKVVAQLARHFNWRGPIGCGMPGPVKDGRIMTANNIDKSWLGVVAHQVFSKACGQKVVVINDADAAALAEMKFGAGRNVRGVVVLLTLGTGIGSAVFHDGVLVPNTELGQIELDGKNAEKFASARVRKSKNMGWKKWAKHVARYVETVEHLMWPDLIFIGGGVSKRANKFIPRIKTQAKVLPAKLQNNAGIIGAALAVSR
jgi:polyphosphate glucokinase